ncbi:MAG: NADP-dependent isocitrate dehydrogenase [Bacteroidota bacterium]
MKNITIAKGDGIGPEIMNAVINIMKSTGVDLSFEEVQIGEKAYLSGFSSGIGPEAWEVIRRNKVFLKAPISTPQGGGYKSLNVTMRKALNLFANVRPCRSFHPYVHTKHPLLDVVVIRENEEDLYAGIEHQQTSEVVQCLKLISRPGCEQIIRYAFEYARHHNRRKVTCLTKDNIMKQTDGLFHQVFREIAPKYPEIEANHMIIDIGTARLADTPEQFDVIVVPNLYGDIISDVVAQITGSVGLAGSVNMGLECAMFEAIHGSAPDIAGKDIANPSGLLQGAIMMLNHIGETKSAALIQNAWLRTLEEGIHTPDIYSDDTSRLQVGTQAFTKALIARLGRKPEKLPVCEVLSDTPISLPRYQRKNFDKKELMGVDLFVDWQGYESGQLANKLKAIQPHGVELSMITNRGIKVWPNGFDETFCTDHWRCRFESTNKSPIAKKQIIELLQNAEAQDIDTIKTENLYTFNGKPAFSLGQGQ